MKKTFLSAVIAVAFIASVISCSSEDSQTNSATDNVINMDNFTFALKIGDLKVAKNDPKALTDAITSSINESIDLMNEDPTIGEVTLPIIEDENYYIFLPYSTEPVLGELIGKCPQGTTQIHSCNGLSSSCQQEVENLVKESFSGLGRGSNVTVNISVSQLGQVRVCRGGEK